MDILLSSPLGLTIINISMVAEGLSPIQNITLFGRRNGFHTTWVQFVIKQAYVFYCYQKYDIKEIYEGEAIIGFAIPEKEVTMILLSYPS